MADLADCRSGKLVRADLEAYGGSVSTRRLGRRFTLDDNSSVGKQRDQRHVASAGLDGR